MHKSQVTSHKKKQSGQIVLILLLVMTVALAIGLSIVQRSLTDISSSTKIEQSSRAFSAAEAGIEKALQGSTTTVTQSFDNNASFNLVDSGLLPKPFDNLEYPPISKEEIVHVWLSDPDLSNERLQQEEDPNDPEFSPIGKYYAQNQLDVYWGSADGLPSSDRAAVELTIVFFDGTNKAYSSKKILLDPVDSRLNNFVKQNPTNNQNVSLFRCSDAGYQLNTIFGENRNFYCQATLSNLVQQNQTLVLLRARVLYSNSSHPFAFKPFTTPCPTDGDDEQKKACSLPPQVRIVQSKGTAGETQRTIQLFTVEKVVPFYFDYAIFSAGDINK